MIKIAKRLKLIHSTFANRCCFSKGQDNNKQEQIKNENYLKSKIPINVSQSQPQKVQLKQAKIKQITDINFNNNKDLKFMILSNAVFMGVIPFVPTIAIGICLLNTGIILSRLGQQIKKYLLLINNDEVDTLGSFRPLSQYLKIILTQMGCLSIQSLLLALFSMEISLAFNMCWIIVSISQKIMSSYFSLALIPVFISIVINFFSQTISSFILNKSPQQIKPK